jgi:hypothetical protein
LEDLGVDRRIILKRFFKKYDVGVNSIYLTQESGFIKCGVFID